MAEIRLACALRFLAGGQILDLRLLFDLSKSECYSSVYRVVDAIYKVIKIEFPIGNKAALECLEAEFRSMSRLRE
jgi:hypothetical protein